MSAIPFQKPDTTRPKALRVLPETIPDELKALASWVTWRYVWKPKDKRWTKVPHTVHGTFAKTDDEKTWATFDAAYAAFERGGYDGIGLVIIDGLAGVDLDHAGEPGAIVAWAAEIIAKFDGAHTERSPSGEGYRIFVRGTAGRCGKGTDNKFIEVYDQTSPRFLTVTGHRVSESDNVPHAQGALDWLHETHFKKGAPPPGANSAESTVADDEIVRRASAAANGAKFTALMRGEGGDDASSNDMALCCLLAFWTRDPEQIDRIFRTSDLMRAKWDERRADSTYGADTIEHALQTVTTFYQWPPTGKQRDIGLSEDAIALEFSRQYADALRRVEEWSRWVRWDGARWATDRTVEVMDLARKLCRKVAIEAEAKETKALRQASFVAAVERLARSDRRHAAIPEQFDADPFVLNTPAGVVDLKTGAETSHDPRLYVTKITAATLGGDCPTFRQFLDRITKGDAELQTFMQRMAGYCLTGSVREHALFFLYGCGANGKSTFVDVLAWLMGDYATVAAMEAFTATQGDRHPADLAALRGARLVTAHETEQGRRWDEARIKVLTGGDPITARFMRGDFFTYQPSFKIVVSGNHKPQLRSVDQAMRRRLHLVPFEAFIPPEERDPDLPAKLRAEASGILSWAIAGCLDWQRQGLRPPKVVREATNEYLTTQDSLQAWIDDCCDVGPNKWDTAALLFGSWKRWADAAGEYVGSQRVFADRLDAAGFQRERSRTARGYVGLAVRQSETPSDQSWKHTADVW